MDITLTLWEVEAILRAIKLSHDKGLIAGPSEKFAVCDLKNKLRREANNFLDIETS